MDTVIDTLAIEIKGVTADAEKSIDNLSDSLSKLGKAARGIGLSGVAKQFKSVGVALSGIDAASISRLDALSNALGKLSVGNVKISSSIANQITNLGTATKSLDGADFSKLADLANAISPLTTIGKNNLGSTVNLKMQMCNDSNEKVEHWSLSVGTAEKTVIFYHAQATKFRFSFEMATADDSYMYFTGTGDIVFAGKNTRYYGMANIDGTPAGGAVATAEVLSFDDDYAMNYAVATASVMGDEPAENPSDVYGLSAEFTEVITAAKKEWMREYGGDFRKIPIIVSTDQHGLTNKGIFKLLGKTVSMHDVSKVMNLGDTVSAWNDGDAAHPLLSCEQLGNWCESVKDIPFSKQLNVFGNHDTWYGNYEDEGNPIGTRYPSSQAHLNQYFRNIYARRTNNNGWFVVHDDQFNVKYVAISAFEYQNDSVSYRMSTAQMTWLIDELTQNDGYDVVIVSHVPLLQDAEQAIYPNEVVTENTYRVANINTDTFFSARKTKTSGTIVDSDGVSHDYDFSGCQNELLCSLHGHTHYDVYLYLDNSLLVNSFDWFQKNTFFFTLIDRVNRQLNIWKIEAPDNVPTYTNYQIPLDKPTE